MTFTKDDFNAADLSGGNIVAVLTSAKKTALEATAGYAFEDAAGDAATNAADQIDIASGFIRDNGLNASTASFTDQVIDITIRHRLLLRTSSHLQMIAELFMAYMKQMVQRLLR